MDQARIWFSRIAAPIAFLVAATILVVVVQRALDDDSASSPPGAEPAGTVPVSTDTVGEGTGSAGETGETGESRFYRIRAGDTLEAIASEFGTTVDRLLDLNPGVDPLALAPGQRIRVA